MAVRKWKAETLIVALTALFILFSVGYFAGRNAQAGATEAAVVTTQFQNPIAAAQPPTLPEKAPDTQPEVPADTGPLDLNAATKEQLMALPGIGEALADRIIAYRQAFGGFVDVQELTQVSGIGERKLEAVRELVTVR